MLQEQLHTWMQSNTHSFEAARASEIHQSFMDTTSSASLLSLCLSRC